MRKNREIYFQHKTVLSALLLKCLINSLAKSIVLKCSLFVTNTKTESQSTIICKTTDSVASWEAATASTFQGKKVERNIHPSVLELDHVGEWSFIFLVSNEEEKPVLPDCIPFQNFSCLTPRWCPLNLKAKGLFSPL
jgi:hypothetical protein